jgi:8-oxo-dGTP pyrophosphatase MutT (NUDIX family)
MTESLSFGIIPFREVDGIREYLLIFQKEGHWAFPKGHKENDETDIEAALRECREEVGIDKVELIEADPIIDRYQFFFNGQTIHRKVSLYLGRVLEDTVTIQKEEINDYAWLPYKEALDRLTYSESKEVLRLAEELLNNLKTN